MAWDYRLLLNLLLSVEMSVYIAATITRKRGFLLTTGLIYVLNFVGYFLASNVPYMLVEFRQLIGIGVLFLGTMFLSRDRWPKVLVICA